MAIARVQVAVGAQAAAPADTVVATLGAGATANNLIVACFGTRSAAATNATGFNTDVEIVNATEDDRLRICSLLAVGGETAITFTGMSVGASGGTVLGLTEISGLLTTGYLDVTASTGRAAGVATLSSGTTATTAQNDTIAIAAIAIRALVVANPVAVDNSFTVGNTLDDTLNGQLNMTDAWRIYTGTAAAQTDFSWTDVGTCFAAIAVYKASGGAAAPVGPLVGGKLIQGILAGRLAA